MVVGAPSVSTYTSLPPGIAATVPKRPSLKDTWIRKQTSSPCLSRPLPSRSTSRPKTLPRRSSPKRPISVDLGKPFAHRRERSWDENLDVIGITGQVKRRTLFFETQPLIKPENKSNEPKDSPRKNLKENEKIDKDKINSDNLVCETKSILRLSKHKRNTISSFPRWESITHQYKFTDNSNPKNNETIKTTIINDIICNDTPNKPQSTESSFSPRRHTQAVNINLRNIPQISKEEKKKENSSDNTGNECNKNEKLTNKKPKKENKLVNKHLFVDSDKKTAKTKDSSNNKDNQNISSKNLKKAGVGKSDANTGVSTHKPVCRCSRSSSSSLDTAAVKLTSSSSVSRRFLNQIPYRKNTSLNVSSSIRENNVSACSVSMGIPDDSGVSAPRVVAASMKSYKDIPEELFNSLPESSVDPSPPPEPAPSEWSNMKEGRRSLSLLIPPDCALSDEETEGSEGETWVSGVASTSDYHTSDGRSSSLSLASGKY